MPFSKVCFMCHGICILVWKLYTADLTMCLYYPQLLVSCVFNRVPFLSGLYIALCPVVPYLIVGILTCMFLIIVASLDFQRFNSIVIVYKVLKLQDFTYQKITNIVVNSLYIKRIEINLHILKVIGISYLYRPGCVLFVT